jgi:TPR repeat protein
MQKDKAMRFLYAVVLLVAVQGASAAFAEGAAAYIRGDYTTALAEWRPLAAQGDANAQFINLGIMYANGEGVPQDYAEAAKWLRLSAELARYRTF